MATQNMNEQQKARIASMMKTWERRKKITQHISQIGRRIGVYSGKGGVGKTTVAVNVAALLAAQGAKVGLLDADVDCPNAYKVLGCERRPEFRDGVLIPAERAGVKIISMASFQEKEDEAIIWRGPMITNALNQFLELTDWGPLDYLIVDLPPGTSDSPLTVMQVLKMDGFIVVTTPQRLATLDAKRSINMIRKMNIPVLGVVENMSGGVFGQGGGEVLAREMGLPLLGTIKLAQAYMEESQIPVLHNRAVRQEYEGVVAGMKGGLEALQAATPGA
jgi:Mrp family chromosome partitioning ATPase